MNKCKSCGGDLKTLGNGTYRCVYCFKTFSEEDFAPKQSPVAQTAYEGVDIFEANKNGTVEITCRFDGAVGSGSGLLINKEGYIITNTHVVTNNAVPCNDITVKIVGEEIKASILMLGDNEGGHGSGVDLALLKLQRLPSTAKPLRFGRFSDVRTGEQVFVIGNSLGDGTCMTSGIVSDRCRTLNGQKLLMTDCAINGGNSGGPIFNSKGLVIGVIVSSRIKRDGSATEGMNYAIPVDVVQEFINGEHSAVKFTAGAFEGEPFLRPTKKCPQCGTLSVIVNRKGRVEHCVNCSYYKRYSPFEEM